MLQGDDGLLSIKRVLAIFFSVVLTIYVLHITTPSEGIATIITFLIVSLLGMSTAQNIIFKKFDINSGKDPNSPDSTTQNTHD